MDQKIQNNVQSRASIDLISDTSDSESVSDVVMPSNYFENGNEDHGSDDHGFDEDHGSDIPLEQEYNPDINTYTQSEDDDLQEQFPMQMEVIAIPSTNNDKSSNISDGKIIYIDAMEKSVTEPSVIQSGVTSFFKMILDLNPFVALTSQAESSSEKVESLLNNDLNTSGIGNMSQQISVIDEGIIYTIA